MLWYRMEKYRWMLMIYCFVFKTHVYVWSFCLSTLLYFVKAILAQFSSFIVDLLKAVKAVTRKSRYYDTEARTGMPYLGTVTVMVTVTITVMVTVTGVHCQTQNNWGQRTGFQRSLVPFATGEPLKQPETDPQLLCDWHCKCLQNCIFNHALAHSVVWMNDVSPGTKVGLGNTEALWPLGWWLPAVF